jgi:hypothetical protein
MSVNNVVSITAGLLYTGQVPSIGSGGLTVSLGFTAGHVAGEEIVNVGVTSTALNTSLGGNGFILVSNPSAVDVTILCGATTMGILPAASPTAPSACLLPCASGVIYNATVAAATQDIYVARVRWTANV